MDHSESRRRATTMPMLWSFPKICPFLPPSTLLICLSIIRTNEHLYPDGNSSMSISGVGETNVGRQGEAEGSAQRALEQSSTSSFDQGRELHQRSNRCPPKLNARPVLNIGLEQILCCQSILEDFLHQTTNQCNSL